MLQSAYRTYRDWLHSTQRVQAETDTSEEEHNSKVDKQKCRQSFLNTKCIISLQKQLAAQHLREKTMELQLHQAKRVAGCLEFRVMHYEQKLPSLTSELAEMKAEMKRMRAYIKELEAYRNNAIYDAEIGRYCTRSNRRVSPKPEKRSLMGSSFCKRKPLSKIALKA